MAGKLIVIEGMDGAGTTTQAKMLEAYFIKQGFKVKLTAEPTDSLIGQEIRRLLAMPLEKEQNLLVALALCFAADRMQHVYHVIEPGIMQSDFVVLDRYLLSSFVYQGLHLTTGFIKEINQFAIKPDLTVVLDLDPTIAYERLSRRPNSKDFYESMAMLPKIRSRYRHFAKDNPTGAVLVDAAGSMDSVHSHIVHIVEEKFARCG